MHKLILRVNTGEYGESTVAYLSLDEELMNVIERRVKLAASAKADDADFVELSFHDRSLEFFEIPWDDNEELYEMVEDSDWVVAPNDFDPEKHDSLRLELSFMNVTPIGVWWEAHQKHCATRMESGFVNLEVLP